MQRIMIDIETLDTKSTAVILSVAAVEFDDYDIGRRFHQYVDIDSCLSHGLTVSGNTIAWWMDQSDAARRIFQRTALPLDRVLTDLSVSFEWDKVDEVWANGSDFDLPILANAYRLIGMNNPPWQYYKGRDYRTFRKLFPRELLNDLTVEPIVEHDALDDAISQVQTLQALSQHVSFLEQAK